jgi:hypothetical protein
MSQLQAHRLSVAAARRELSVFSEFLKANAAFAEREVVRLLRESPNLTVLIGTLGRGMALADAFKYEFRIQGLVSADLVLRSRARERVFFVEFEGGRPASIFGRTGTSQLREWSREIEHATSQIIDWSWALSDAARSRVLSENLGAGPLNVEYLVVCGRDASLDSELLRERFVYRHARLNIAGSAAVFFTYDGLLREIGHALAEFRTEGPP